MKTNVRAIIESRQDCRMCSEELPPDAMGSTCPACMRALLLHEGVADNGYPETSEETRDRGDHAAKSEGPGTLLGRYRLLERIGEGGFGVVYIAEQEEPVRRRVALKIVKLGMDTEEVVARFEAERQALAMMDHSNIAKVHDGGVTPGGRPFFVMELVEGQDITGYCDDRKLSIGERLELFNLVCRAIQHAHQKGVIHRDIKPSNVMVAVQDGKPTPKVIDFGIAKAIQQPLSYNSSWTRTEQFMGSPIYMSPEQTTLTSFDVDTRTDVYSLGVLLYELLTGSPPFDPHKVRSSSHDDVRKMIQEQAPERPSTRLDNLTSSELKDVAQSRSSLPHRLPRSLRGDLDWIVMKALEKDRMRRYESVSALALDVRRHLNGEAVDAIAPTLGYRFRKFVQRNKAAVTAVSTAITALLAGSVMMGYGLVESKRNADTIRASEKKWRRVAMVWQDTIGVADPWLEGGEPISVQEMVDRFSASLASGRYELDDDVKLTLDRMLGRVYENQGREEKAKHHLTNAFELARKLYPEDSSELALVKLDYINVLEPGMQIRFAREALAVLHRKKGPHHLNTLQAREWLGTCYYYNQEYEKAIGELQKVWRELDGRLETATQTDLATPVLRWLGLSLAKVGRHVEAESTWKEWWGVLQSRYEPNDPAMLLALYERCRLLRERGDYRNAIQRLEILYPKQEKAMPGHPQVVETLKDLYELYLLQDDPVNARKWWILCHQRALECNHCELKAIQGSEIGMFER